MNRRRFLQVAGGAAVLGGLYVWRVAPAWVEVVRRNLPIAHLPPALAGKTLVHLSDLHIGPQVDDDYLRHAFGLVAALQPDFVVHTGDLVTYRDAGVLDQAARVLRSFPTGRLGTVAILGNHDYGRNWSEPRVAEKLTDALRVAGCRVLRNAHAEIGGLHFIGCDDLWASRFHPSAALRALPANAPVLALCHNPDACDLPLWDGYAGWILSGHTHGGQCKPPFLPPPLLPVRNRRYVAGEYELSDRRRLYINRGLGHLLRVRFNVRPEITVFSLTSTQPS